MKIWKLLTAINIIVLGFNGLLLYNLYQDECQIVFLFDLCFTVDYSFYTCSYIACYALINKLVNKRTRGTMMALNSLAGSIVIAIFNELAGYLYDQFSKKQPFLVLFYVYSFSFVVTIILGVAGKINS